MHWAVDDGVVVVVVVDELLDVVGSTLQLSMVSSEEIATPVEERPLHVCIVGPYIMTTPRQLEILEHDEMHWQRKLSDSITACAALN